jgi:hypothetical protein
MSQIHPITKQSHAQINQMFIENLNTFIQGLKLKP